MKQQKEIMRTLIPILIVGVIFSLFDMTIRFFSGNRLFSPRAILFSFFYGLFFSSFSLLFKKKRAKQCFLLFILFLAATLAFTQTLYYQFFNDYYSFTMLTNIKEFLVVKGETAKALKIEYWIEYVIAAMGSGLIVKTTRESERRNGWAFLSVLLVAALGIGGVKLTFRNRMDDDTQLYLTDDYLYSTLYNKRSAMERFGVYAFAQRDLFRTIGHLCHFTDPTAIAKIDDYFDEHRRSQTANEKTGLFAGKNLVLILAESFNPWGIHDEITPTLAEMKKTGYYFENYYSPTFLSHTIDAEFAVNTDLIPSLDYGNTAYMFSDNAYPQSLANLFLDKGYRTLSFHNSTGSFYNRYQYHQALGYQHFYDAEELGIEIPSNFGYNWASDIDLFEKASDVLLKEKADQPFLAYLITVSMHTPYDDNRLSLKENVQAVQEIVEADSQVQYYLAAAKQFDDGLRAMQERFEEAGILDDTVFVIFADHYSYGMHHDILWSYYDDYIGDFYRIHNVPLMIWTPNMQDAQVFSEPCSQFEVYPTLANLFGLNYDATFTVGNDLFNFEENLIIFGKAGTWQDENVIYDENGVVAVLNPDADLSYVSEKNAAIMEMLDVYQKVLEQDYFATKDYQTRTKQASD